MLAISSWVMVSSLEGKRLRVPENDIGDLLDCLTSR
jgi:hypothetical protein